MKLISLQLLAALCLFGCTAQLAAQGIVGLNFSVIDKPETELAPEDVAGLQDVEQSNWNNLAEASGSQTTLKNAQGEEVTGLSTTWHVPTNTDNSWRSKLGAAWGFTGNNLNLQAGYIQLGGNLNVTGIPFPKYDVHVYMNADAKGGIGELRLSSGDSRDLENVFYYSLDWLNGRFVTAISKDVDSVEKANHAVFTANTAKEFTLEWKGDVSGGWTGISAVQIVETP